MSMSMPTGDEDEGEVISDMNTTPLIDVMLVLLIMLIISIPIQTHAVKLNLPTSTNSNAPSQPPKVVEIGVAKDGTITWDGTNVDREALEARIVEAASFEPQPEIHLRPDKAAKYEVVAAVMASSQRLGLTKIGLTGNEQYVGL